MFAYGYGVATRRVAIDAARSDRDIHLSIGDRADARRGK
jgi:hypothetical protein